MKVGEALVKDGLITREQLERALQRQVQFGGRIGTNIVELKLLGEDELTKFLGRFFKIPPISPDMIVSIEEEVVNSVSPEIVDKYKILPFRKERSRLHAALLNPKDIKAMDELRFITGYDIVPYVIAELRLLYALEKYYGIKRELRYISVLDRFNPEAKVEAESIDRIKAAFAGVKETGEIAEVLIQAAYKIAERTAVFIIKGGKIAGWRSKGLNVEGFSAAEEEPSIFSDVLKRKSHFRGPVLNIKGNEPLIKLLSGTPQDALLIPISVREKIVALFYVDNGNQSVLDANVGYLSKLAGMAGVAFEMMILRKKIMEM
jgi:hypothetical protein